ncbi:hypothetical protein C0583_05665 [Candidatus Parcubacteria bacterium]|nr:MAG: hypothetical protein C0583_05665 [Candidatus Parcubacteria bacterium]
MPNEAQFMSAINKPTVHGKYENQDTKEKGSLEKRIEDNMNNFREQFATFNEDEPILIKAQELLDEFGSSSNIPESELDFDKSNFDEARLLGMAKILENNQ